MGDKCKKLCECGCGKEAPIAKWTSGRYGHIKGQHVRFIRGHHLRGKTAEKNHNWRGGRVYSGNGYALIYNPGHPRADVKGYVYEHILIAEKALGKPLPPKVVVHHVNETKDSGPLVICQDDNYHKLLHKRMRARRKQHGQI